MKLILLLFSSAAFAQTTPNMSLTKPPLGDPNYATKINNDLNLIDAHDHSPGKGVRIGTAGIQDGSITAAKIQSGSIGPTQIANGSVTEDKIAAGAVTATKIGASAVTTSAISDFAVTTNKLVGVTAALGGASVGNVAYTAGVTVTGVVTTAFVSIGSVTLATKGNPVYVGLRGLPDLSAPYSGALVCTRASVSSFCQVRVQRNGTTVMQSRWGIDHTGSGASSSTAAQPASAVSFIDVTPGCTSCIYDIAITEAGGAEAQAWNTSVFAYELK